MKTIKLRIDCAEERKDMLCALANNSYKVWIEEKRESFITPGEYFVCFEVPDEAIAPKKTNRKENQENEY